MNKRTVFVDYQFLKDKLNVEASSNPDLIVDDSKFQDKSWIRIDKSFIKKLKLRKLGSDTVISVTTIHYKKRKKKRPEIYIRGITTAYNKGSCCATL